jgi:hypothetical protein
LLLGLHFTLKMKAMYSSKTSGFLQNARRYNPKDSALNSHRCENLKTTKTNAWLKHLIATPIPSVNGFLIVTDLQAWGYIQKLATHSLQFGVGSVCFYVTWCLRTFHFKLAISQ